MENLRGAYLFLLPLREKVARESATDEGSTSLSGWPAAMARAFAERLRDPSSGPPGHLLPQGEKGREMGLGERVDPPPVFLLPLRADGLLPQGKRGGKRGPRRLTQTPPALAASGWQPA